MQKLSVIIVCVISTLIADVPVIVSSNKIAYLDPQEKLWRNESGKYYNLSDILSSDSLIPFNGIADFNSHNCSFYNRTLFRFPLRTEASDLSENAYSVGKVLELIKALKAEAKFLLVFLRSVASIEVFEISTSGNHSLLFSSKITDEFLTGLTEQRSQLIRKVKQSYERYKYNSSEVHSFLAKFDVETFDHRNGVGKSSWLVCNQVGSSNSTVRSASTKQNVFPWVGTALELDSNTEGRIFCFLPMPIESLSNLPIHINGTFGLTDDRRSLKWPGLERRNDPTAEWNMLLVKEVLPPCYSALLLNAKEHLTVQNFYTVWPDSSRVHDNWRHIISPFLNLFLSNSVIKCEYHGRWVLPGQAVYVPISGVSETVLNTLVSCNVQLAKVPELVFRVLKHHGVHFKEVDPAFVRQTIRSNVHCYRNLSHQQKLELLKYCWSDGNYSDFNQLELLPLANNTFSSFQSMAGSRWPSYVYLCSSECPKYLLPNLDHKIVDCSKELDVQRGLTNIARTNLTQLKILDVNAVASLLDESMPAKWRKQDIVHYPCQERFPSEWFQNFWEWIRNKNLSLFGNKLIVPTQAAGYTGYNQFSVVRLQLHHKAFYFPSYQAAPKEVLSSLHKIGIHYSLQSKFSYLTHPSLSSYVNNFSARSFLVAIKSRGHYQSVKFTNSEASSLKTLFFDMPVNLTDVNTLKQIKIFKTSVNTQGKLSSVEAVQKSILRVALVEPSSFADILANLPDSIILFSGDDYTQTQVLSKLGISSIVGASFLVNHVFPMISARHIHDTFIDNIMKSVLNLYDSLSSQNYDFADSVGNLRFVLYNSLGDRKSPRELFNPQVEELSSLFKKQEVFPKSMYYQYVHVLNKCGLRNSVTPQEILDMIYSISTASNSAPQPVDGVKISRAKSILTYIQASGFRNQARGSYSVHNSVHRGHVPFDTALMLISEKRCWLPVLANPPSHYPDCLPWKGSGYSSHVVSINNQTCVSCSSRSELVLSYGSQAYFTDPSVSLGVYQWLGGQEPTSCLCQHFSEVISNEHVIDPDQIFHIVCTIYSAMSIILKTGDKHYLNGLKRIKKWIYLKKSKMFVDVKSVAGNENKNFRHSIEPFLHILPDSISQYSELFLHFGMNHSITHSQIVSILDTIKYQVSNQPDSVDTEVVWNMIMAILNWLTNNATQEISMDRVLVPAESHLDSTNSKSLPQLKSSDSLVFTDNDFLKEFMTSSSEQDSNLCFTHSRINPNLAKCLKVTPLSKEMDVSEDTFCDAGQSEPLTVRLKNILKDYKDGVTIVKELIQNADDAEATELNICYDTRNHSVERKRLFFPGMSESHGPALIVHNNATFADEDFDNIQKLAAATKADKQLKIGKFGIGFCSAYHITDVPSFISRDRMYIFDPTLKHLGKEVKNPSQPGKRVLFLNYVIQRSLQLCPYEELFGFKKSAEYKGTMFRLPFRSSPSELSSTCYSQSHVQELFEAIKECGERLLMFLQHVRKITIQRIGSSETEPTILYELSKCTQSYLTDPYNSYMTKPIEIQQKEPNSTKSSTWLIASSSATYAGKTAVAMVASSITPDPKYEGMFNVDSDIQGEIFCFLPLSQSTGLPVHVSCNFAVINNRRGIWTTAEATSRTDSEVQWNIFLMEKVIPKTYSNLLCYIRDMSKENLLINYKCFTLWPLSKKLQMKNPWDSFVDVFYSLLPKECLFYSQSTLNWVNRSASKFLLDNILGSNGNPDCIVELMDHLNLPIVEMPEPYRYHIPINEGDINSKHFVKLFFKNLVELCDDDITESRNKVLKILLEISAEPRDKTQSEIAPLLKQHFASLECIPCEPDGTLRKSIDLIHPGAPFAPLFDESDRRFPIELLVSSLLAIKGLQNGGMQCDVLSWNLVRDRAESVQSLYKQNVEFALKRAELLISTLARHVLESPPCEIRLSSIPFLPVLFKPSDYPLEWAGDNEESLLCGQSMIVERRTLSTKNSLLAGSQVCIVDDSNPVKGGCGIIPVKVQKLLNLRSEPTVTEVISHLKVISLTSCDFNPAWITQSCSIVYDFLNHELASSVTEIEEMCGMKSFPCLWNGSKFITTEDVAKDWKRPQGPYLYSIPEVIVGKTNLIEALSIKDEFSIEDALTALEKMKIQFQDDQIDECCKALVDDILFTILKSVQHTRDLAHKVVYLPSEELVLHQSKELAYNDAWWDPKDEGYHYVHNNIPRHMAVLLGVRLVRSKMLDQFLSKNVHFPGVEFGQREELTRRIQNIIRDYPFDITLLKELLQNADDAKAKKLHIILDKRTHGKNSLISENWQKLQGPSLLIWNDSIFSEKDLKGIQELGLGSKRSESETIGQYGIGFNVVYHLTDCPSFITGGETLCIMDPHCMYADGATSLSPGRRYKNLSERFWNHFEDMSSAYLINGVNNLPELIQHGSLFRFPLRHSKELVQSSKILDHSCGEVQPMTADKLEEKLMNWFPDMKGAMLFLQHISEIKFMVIEENADELSTVYHYSRCIPDEEKYSTSITKFENSVSKFSHVSSPISSRVLYPVKITEHIEKGKNMTEEWLIQQGIGDLNKQGVNWKYSRRVKPRHGIAAPLNVCSSTRGKKKQLYCFLPLPTSIDLPVHINGSFILDSNRRDLWSPSDPNELDDKSRWNQNLFIAIASSYADFLKQCKSYYVDETYHTWKTGKEDIRKFYEVFPLDTVVKYMKFNGLIVKELYKILVSTNPEILCVILTKQKTNLSHLVVQWQPLISNREDQVYFWGTTKEQKEIHPILESIGMKITPSKCLQYILNNFLSNEKKKIPSISPATVFEYYTVCSSYSALKGMTIKPISGTVFGSPEKLSIFLKFLLGIPLVKAEVSSTLVNQYISATKDEKNDGMLPNCPFSHFLLLTADDNLRAFDGNAKVLRSEFFNVFSDHPDKFLHPSLLELKMNKSYFICDFEEEEEEEENKQYAVDLITQIFMSALPGEMSTSSVIEETSTTISKNDLFKYWDIFNKDDVLRSYLPFIVKKIALLPTLDDRLFSLSSEILPMYLPHSTDNLPVVEKAIKVFCKLKLPFLDTSIVTVRVECPDITANADIVLRNLVLVNNEKCLTSVLKKEDIKILIDYFIEYLDVRNCLPELRSLPLFENVAGEYQALLSSTAYVWPDSCSDGYNNWVKGHYVIFLKSGAYYNRLGSQTQFSIQAISELGLYNQFIFPNPHFGLMTEEERYGHLIYIRENLFESVVSFKDMNKTKRMDASRKQKIREAQLFFHELIALKCIGPTNAVLLPISSFCDHTQDIFCEFPKDFKLLPVELRDKKNLKFFKNLKLKVTLSSDEFIKLCNKTSRGDVADIRKKSKILLEWLCLKGLNYDDQSLWEISNIPFVFAERPSKVDWVLPGASQPNLLIKLNGSALLKLEPQVWTVRPLVYLPVCEKSLRDNLGVVSIPADRDLISNIKNISATRYSDDQLFSNYPSKFKPPSGENDRVFNLVQILEKNFRGFKQESDLSELACCACIPVHAQYDLHDGRQVVLVRPNHVVAASTKAKKFHPYLNALPVEFMPLLHVLQKIDVSLEIHLKHAQIILEKVFTNSKGLSISVNADEVVQWSIQLLNDRLPSQGNNLSPLYLPDTNNIMRLSTDLIYRDNDLDFMHLKLNLEESSLYHLNLPDNKYKFIIQEFCNKLPDSVRPKKLSEQSVTVPDKSCERVSHTKLAQIFMETFQDESCPLYLAKLISHILAKESLERSFAAKIKSIFESITIITMKNFKAQVKLKNSENIIGEMKSTFAFDSNECYLYINSNGNRWTEERIASHMANHILDSLSQSENFNRSNLVAPVKLFLRSSKIEKMEMLETFKIGVVVESNTYPILNELGEEIPHIFHNRLDQHVDNIYNPMEIVGYEETENIIVWAKVIYLKRQGQCSIYNKVCKIYVNETDTEGIEVSILKLYKFIEGDKKPRVTSAVLEDESRALVPHDDRDNLSQFRTSMNQRSLADKKRIICDQLREITTLADDQLRRTAIRRLYLQYHPDKNTENAEEYDILFRFLLNQIKHLENNEDLDDPDASESSTTSRSRSTSSGRQNSRFTPTWSRNFENWNSTARSHKQSRTHQSETHQHDSSGNFFRQFRNCSSSSENRRDTNNCNPSEGWRWIRQAKLDFRDLQSSLKQTENEGQYSLACFLAHQVAEKALKGVLIALCGLENREMESRTLLNHANILCNLRPQEALNLPELCDPLVPYYQKTRYPDQWPGCTDAPSDHYHQDDAEQAMKNSQEILRIIISLMPDIREE